MRVVLGILRTMRPKQWTKNVLFIFPAILFDGQLLNMNALGRVVLAALLMIVMSGTVYIINDLVDVEKDRQHPKKRTRPIASGEVPIRVAVTAAFILPTATLLFALWWDRSLAVVMLIYLIVQVTYSLYLKHVPILDILAVTTGFVLRILAGVVVIDVANFSPWLYACGALLALFLVVGKRRQELLTLGETALKTRPIFEHYNLALLDDMLRLVVNATFIAYLLYTIEVDTVRIADINASLVTVPFVLYALFRYLYLIHVRGEGSAPDEVLLTDRPLQLAIFGWGLTVFILIYLF
ncbi:MAG: decaprenyl-phosphate phosphoribosyltransferase [Anaerolineae bacterium]|nr:decaprenyl-phosphate phosphoribosyltransferase [Anaerolineae bacterium]